jgi:TetR/AcrR family transcriptional regulator
MPEPGESRRGRVHDAEGAREAILNAAEAVFAEHGFDGARIDAIATTAGYNKSLLFQYFGDKLGLYTEVLRRADSGMNEMQVQILTSLASLLNEEILSHVHEFKQLLKTAIGAFFDYMVAHPHFMRIMAWEMAEGWQTFAKIVSARDREDMLQFRALMYRAQDAGLLRSGLDPSIQLTLALYQCLYYPAFVPLFQILLSDEDFSSAAALVRAREYVIETAVAGVIVDPQDRQSWKGS